MSFSKSKTITRCRDDETKKSLTLAQNGHIALARGWLLAIMTIVSPAFSCLAIPIHAQRKSWFGTHCSRDKTHRSPSRVVDHMRWAAFPQITLV